MRKALSSGFAEFASKLGKADPGEILRRWIASRPRDRLPTVRELGTALHRSSRDIAALLVRLRREGVVETRQGSGSWPVGSLPPQAAAKSEHPSSTARSLELIEEIQRGIHPTGHAMPSAKHLAARWNCHPQTVSKILKELTIRGILLRNGRQWWVARPKPVRARSAERILLVGSPNDVGELRMDSDREIEYWRDISMEIARNGLESSRHLWTGGSIPTSPGTIGLIVSTWHQSESAALLDAAGATRLPVCTWMEGLDEDALDHLGHRNRLHLHDVAHSEQAGRDMGQHLFQRSVRKVAWISPFQAASWARSREAGLRHSLEAGHSLVRSFGLERISEWDFVAPAWGDPLLWEMVPAPGLDTLTGGRSRPVIAQAAEQLGLRWLMEELEPHLEQALAWNAEAWVACNDRIAALLKEWLIHRNAWNPSKLALAGFDDSALSLRHDLTSYRFDTASMARSMVLQILSYRQRERKPRLVRHGGHVVPRGSTSRLETLT